MADRRGLLSPIDVQGLLAERSQGLLGNVPTGEMRAHVPSLRDRIGNMVFDAATAMGLKQSAQRMRSDAGTAFDFIPGIGDAVGANEAGRAFGAGRYGDAALGASLTAVGAIPGVGDAAAAGVRKGIRALPEFERWFGASKVADAEGNPRVLYKGHPTMAGGPTRNWKGDIIEDTPWTEIESFDNPSRPNVAGFFSDKSDVANRFAEAYSKHLGDTPVGVTPVYVKMERPFVIDANGRHAASVQFNDPVAGWSNKAFNEALENPDYDGIIIRNTADEGDVYVPKKPTQIKSIHNRKFDPKDPRVLYSIGGLLGAGAAAEQTRPQDRT